jgi:tRNA 2-thiouridine synthesizing protein E
MASQGAYSLNPDIRITYVAEFQCPAETGPAGDARGGSLPKQLTADRLQPQPGQTEGRLSQHVKLEQEEIDMALEVNGKTLETDDNGNLIDATAWDEDVARAIAAADDTMDELTQEHFDVLKYLREEYFNNNNNQPMERQINKDMGKIWGRKLSSKDLYKLFPGAPSKQGNRIAGLPYVARKGGY